MHLNFVHEGLSEINGVIACLSYKNVVHLQLTFFYSAGAQEDKANSSHILFKFKWLTEYRYLLQMTLTNFSKNPKRQQSKPQTLKV